LREVSRLIQMQEAAAEGFGGGLGAVADAQLGEDVADVALDGVLGDVERGADFLVALAGTDEAEDFDFALADIGPATRSARRRASSGGR
jgi:hypothetical protein